MPNTTTTTTLPYIIDEASVRLDVNNRLKILKQFLDDNDDWQYPTLYKVLEYFPENEELKFTREYEVTNLTVEIEDEVLCFDDAEGYLEEDLQSDSPASIHHLLKSNILYISFDEDLRKITISTIRGYIMILYWL